jgi:hypothetical protein
MGEVDGLRHGLGYKPAEVVHGPDERRVLGAISPPSLRTTMPLGSLPVRRISGSRFHMRVPEIYRRMAQDLRSAAKSGRLALEYSRPKM